MSFFNSYFVLFYGHDPVPTVLSEFSSFCSILQLMTDLILSWSNDSNWTGDEWKMPFFQYALLQVALWYPDQVKLPRLRLHSDTIETIESIITVYHGAFMEK